MSPTWFTKCCGCIPLRVGALVLGYLLTILNVVELFATTISISALNMMIGFTHAKVDDRVNLARFILYALAIVYVFQMVLSINLLVGIHKKERVTMKKFFKIYPILMLIYYFLFFVVLCVNAEHYTQKEWLFHIADVFILFFQLYTVFIIVQYCYELKDQELLLSTGGAGNMDDVEFVSDFYNTANYYKPAQIQV